MRLPKLLAVLAVFAVAAGLAASLLWCVGSCCEAPRGASPVSIGDIPCCGTGAQDRCQSSFQRADAAPLPFVAAPLSASVLFDDATFAPTGGVGAFLNRVRVSAAPRTNLSVLHAPLLI
jgi:hypothetical protein